MIDSIPADAERLSWLSRRASAALGILTFLGGMISFLGWGCDLPRLTDWANTGISIQPNATLAAMASGGALFFLALRLRRAARLAAALVGLIGGSALFENLTGVNLGIDQLFMFGREWGKGATLVPGRMGLPGSISWTLTGTAILLAFGSPTARRAAPLVGLLIAGIASLSLVGYAFGVDPLYSLPRFTAIAAQTATLLVVMGLGLMAGIPDCQPMRTLLERSGSGMLARRSLSLIIVLPVVLGYVQLQGHAAGLYDSAMGTALLVFSLILIMLLGLGRVVYELRAWERSLAAANEALGRADMALRSASEQVVLMDSAWRYTFVNDRVPEATGLDREQLLGRTLWELFPALLGSELETAARRAMGERSAARLDYFFPPWNRWFDLRIYPTPDGGLAFFVLEITERKRAEAALQASDRKKDEFLATLAHELRNPLAPIRTAVRIIRLQGESNPQNERQHEIIERQVGNMAHLLDDLLDVSRITRGTVTLKREYLDLTEVVSRVVEPCRLQLRDQQRELRVDLTAQSLPLHVDRVRVEQVVMNLVNNAAKYTGDGGIITVQTRREGAEAVLLVRDNGRGISPELLPHIFELFVQDKRNHAVSQGGLGIGLTLVKEMVQLHGGCVHGRSEGLDRGSEFEVRLPLAAEADVTSRPLPLNRAKEEKAVVGARHRVLVVDDNRDAAEGLGELLELWGYEMRAVFGGQEALEILRTYNPEVIFLDIGMPHLDGYEVCRRIREDAAHSTAYLVAVTGFGQEEDRRRSRAAGFNEHLTKPVDPDRIQCLLSTHFSAAVP